MEDPLTHFRMWLDEARDAGAFEPEAMAVATATADGAPSVRMVLMKGHDERGIVFFTNYASRKGEELDALSVRPNRRTGERFSLRWVVLHMIEEYARHNGHADLLRESIDGQTGE